MNLFKNKKQKEIDRWRAILKDNPLLKDILSTITKDNIEKAIELNRNRNNKISITIYSYKVVLP